MKAWIARDENGAIHIFIGYIPSKDGLGLWVGNSMFITEQDLPEGINPQWSDDEPIEVELEIKIKG